MPKINIPAIQVAMKQRGLSGRKLAEQLEISPQTVTNWLSDATFPHPAQLLKLALNLRIPFEKLVIQGAPTDEEPRVAARARMNRVLSDATLAELKGMGRLLEQLAENLPFDTLESPPRLTAPSISYEYLQRVSKKVRSEIGVNSEEPIKFTQLVDRFSKHNAILIPVLWGKKDGHENAIHVLLPKSGTTWVYLNLDTYLPDFKFWMAHELGHVYSPSLSGQDAEKFADAFAGALLFPEAVAARAYLELAGQTTQKARLEVLQRYADKYQISNYSVYKEANSYASAYKKKLIEIKPQSLHSVRHGANQNHGTLAETLWSKDRPSPKEYVKDAAATFKTPFFSTLAEFLKSEARSAAFVQAMLDIPLLDAKALHSELV
jgi:transcriptional regulator with XRE-family HTH domain